MKFLILLAFISTSSWAENEFGLMRATQPQLITLKNAINLAQQNNFDFKRTQAQLIQAQSKVWLQASGLLPNLSFGAHFPLRGEVEAKKANFMLSVPIFDAKTLVSSKASHESLRAARLNTQFANEKLIHQVAYLYTEALMGQSLLELGKEEHDKFLQYQQIVERRVKVGTARALDLSSATYQSNKSASDLFQKEREYNRKLADLGAYLGLKETFKIFMFNVESPSFFLPPDILIAMAQNTAEVNALQRDLASNKYILTSEAMAFLPTLKASVDSGWSGLLRSQNFSTQIMLNLELPLFSGTNSLAQMRHQRAQIVMAELNLREKEAEKYFNVLGRLDQISSLKKSQESSALALVSAEEAANSTERLYSQGALTTLDLKDASLQFFSAKNDLLEATLNLMQSQLALLLLVGKLGDLGV